MANVWTQLGTGPVSRRQACLLNESAPSGATEGQPLAGVMGFTLVLTCNGASTFDGTGTMLAWAYLNSVWVRAPRGDFDMTELASLNKAALPAVAVASPIGNYAYQASGIGASAGTTMTIDYVCSMHGVPNRDQG